MFRPLTRLYRGRNLPVGRSEQGSDPFFRLHSEMNRLFEDAFSALPTAFAADWAGAASPRLDLKETDDAFQVEVELPGVAEDDIDVEIADNVLTIRGEKRSERKDDDGDGYHFVERSFGAFSRSIPLPADVDPERIEGVAKNGVLKLTLPKLPETERRGRKISIKRG